MKFNSNRAKEAGIDTGAAVAGAVAGLAVSNKVTALIASNSSASTLTRHVPAMLLLAVIGAQALDIVPNSPLVDSALQGVAVVTGMQAVREYAGANTPAGLTATTGIAALVNTYVPAFTAEGQSAMSASSAVTVDAATAALQGLGLAPYQEPIDFRNPAQAMLASGREQSMRPQPRQLGNPGGGATPKFMG